MLGYRTAVRYGLIKVKRAKIKESRSFCDFCGRQLKWYENIPVVSWLIQKGQTRCCGRPLPREYPIIEILTGVAFLLIFNFQFSIFNFQFSIFNFIIISLLIFSLVFDLKYMILPDFSTYILIISALALWSLSAFGDWSYLWSMVGAFSFLLLLHLGTKGKGMGLGDVKLALFMGLFLGFPGVVVAFYVAFIVGAVVGVGLMIFKKVGRKTMIPFGPFLILGTVVARFIIKL